MRISVDKRDKGYRFNFDTKRIRVYLDGQLFARAVTADEEENMVVAIKHDISGAPLVRLGANGKPEGFELEVLQGKVHIEILGDDGQSIRTPKVKIERHFYEIHVFVYSRLSPKNIRRIRMSKITTKNLESSKLIQLCGIIAGAGAEHLCEKFGDLFDPSEAANAGMAACQEMLANEEKLTRH